MAQDSDSATRRANAEFIRKTMAVPLLSKEQEFELARAWKDLGDKAALHDLILAYNRLVVSTASRFRNYGLPVSDLMQEGVLGLLHAANRFEPDRDIRFSTYASWWIRSSMQDFILRNWSIVRTGTTANQKSLFFNLRRLRSKIEERDGGQMTEEGREEISVTLGVPMRDVRAMEARLSGNDSSLNAPIGEDGDDDWQDLLSDDRATPEQQTVSRLDGSTRAGWIESSLAILNTRERIIIERRRLTDDGVTLEQLGKDFGVSKERVRQLEHRALEKLRDYLSGGLDQPLDLIPEDSPAS